MRQRVNFFSGITLLWAFAEASVFIIVVDVWLSFAALSDKARARKACILAVVGALLGGSLMYYLGIHHAENTRAVLVSLPGISPSLLETVHHSLKEQIFYPLFTAGFLGIPYKIYAVELGNQNDSFPMFLICSTAARYARFRFSTELIGLFARTLLKNYTLASKRIILILCWLVFYLFYFS